MPNVFSKPSVSGCVDPKCNHVHSEENYLLALQCGHYLCLYSAEDNAKP